MGSRASCACDPPSSWTRWSRTTPARARGTGFRFDHVDGTGMIWAVDQALAVYKDRKAWQRLMRNGMARDFSWERSARAYVELYRRAMAKV